MVCAACNNVGWFMEFNGCGRGIVWYFSEEQEEWAYEFEDCEIG